MRPFASIMRASSLEISGPIEEIMPSRIKMSVSLMTPESLEVTTVAFLIKMSSAFAKIESDNSPKKMKDLNLIKFIIYLLQGQ